jgi:tetratricopeptide (TPR) repeat protein
MKTIDKYLFQAMDNYPYCLQETLESLEFSLSYNDKNTMALCLYGRILSEQLQDYEEAKLYFQEAITININALEIYPFYIHTLILNEDYAEATKLINFSLTIKGINKVVILIKKAMLQEIQCNYKEALETFKEIKKIVINDYFKDNIEDSEKRIKSKMEKLKKDKPKKDKSKKKKK